MLKHLSTFHLQLIAKNSRHSLELSKAHEEMLKESRTKKIAGFVKKKLNL